MLDMARQRGRGGRPSLGERDAMMIRPASALGERVRDAADEAGMTITDYVSTILAREHGCPELAPNARPTDQTELPLAQAS